MVWHVLKFVAKRLGYSVLVLLGLSILVFVLARMVPTDVVRATLGQQASEEAIQRMRTKLHLDDPLPLQYYYWITGAIRGDLGLSLVTKRPVRVDLLEFIPATLELALASLIFSIVLGQALGVVAARYQNTAIDHVSRLIAYSGTVTPAFIFGIILMLVFGHWLDIFPAMGRLTAGMKPPSRITGMLIFDGLVTGRFDVVRDALWHIVLPALSLALSAVAQESRVTRSGMIDNFRKSYVRTARANAIPESVVMFKYVLKPSLIPTVSLMGMDFGSTVSNAFLVELVFFWPGFSRYGVNAMLEGDLFAISAVVLVLGAMFILMNLIVDVVTSVLDPRISLAERS